MSAKTKTNEARYHDALELIRQKNAEIVDLKRTLTQIRRENDTAEKIRQEVFGLATHTCEPPAWTTDIRSKKSTRGTPLTRWSDWHYGETVDADQIGGVNQYNK